MRALIRWAVLVLLMAVAGAAAAQTAPIARYARFTGNVNFVATGGSLRTQSNNGDYCDVGNSSSAPLSGIPAGASIVAAYLYWGGSGTTTDSTVTFNGSSVTASRTFTTTVTGPTRTFFGGFANVTSRITGNGTLSFSGLAVDEGGDYCSSATVVAGWGLVVIYGAATERLRAINIFDGLESFFGSALPLSPDGFRIPASGIDGKMAVITWDGDPANSGASGGFSESLRFNGTLLDDGIIVAGSDPPTQQYDGTINSLGISTSYGVDVDTYNVSSLLTPAQTSATTLYSSGGDRVFLTAQVVSVTSEPVVDLSLTKTHSGNFTAGTNATYTLTTSNSVGSQRTDFPITVTDTLPAGLTYVSAAGTGWSCGASGQTVTCTHQGPLNAGASLPAITLTAAVGNGAFPSVVNTAQVATPSFDPVSGNNTASDTATVLGSNLSTSTKTVQDLNGGDANPGDTLRYTITLRDTSGIATTGVSVTDDIPGNVSNFSVVSVPAGASNASTGSGTGANGTGRLNVTGISVPASGSVTVTFNVQVAAGTSPGATIDNTATISNPAGTGATPSAPQVIVSASQIAGSGVKQLYLWSNPNQRLYRTAPSGSHPAVSIAGSGGSATWTLTPALQTPLSLNAGSFPVRLLLSEGGTGSLRTVRVTLTNSSLGTIATASQDLTLSATPSLVTYTLNTGAVSAPANSTFSLVITNNSSSSGRTVSVSPLSGGNNSRVELNSATVINVNSVATYNAAQPAGTATSSFTPGATAYIRAVVSDPFGSFDIRNATITLIDSAGTTQVNNQAVTTVLDSGAATKTFEYAYAVPANAAAGSWTIRVTANEGFENTISDLGVDAFTVILPLPSIQVTKISQVVSDPVNGASNPKRIPGSVQLYTIIVTNSGPGAVDAASLVLTDAVPANTVMYVNGGSGDPVAFTQGSVASGLSFSYPSNVTYSNQPGGGAPYNYTPVPDPNGYDANVRGVRIAPAGAMIGAGGSGSPSFTLQFRVKVN